MRALGKRYAGPEEDEAEIKSEGGSFAASGSSSKSGAEDNEDPIVSGHVGFGFVWYLWCEWCVTAGCIQIQFAQPCKV